MKNQTISLKRSTALGVATLLIGAGVASAQLGSILKVGGAILIADKFGGQINSVLNKATGQKNLADAGIASKVVPILSLGSRKAVGIVQVSGSQAAIDQTKAVAQIETKLPLSGNARILIPINTRSVTDFKRVPGVGVSAVIDIKF
ncbi:hypothetical protein IAD21_00434 [Abditibacteriota bacterium]|nr:hypothetical protein IAD21_00434 [Abditibacteriota bacterium]